MVHPHVVLVEKRGGEVVSDIGTKWRHKKSGGVYEIIDDAADIQCSAMPEVEATFADDVWIAYRNVNGGSLFFRPWPEFMDGRFERVAE